LFFNQLLIHQKKFRFSAFGNIFLNIFLSRTQVSKLNGEWVSEKMGYTFTIADGQILDIVGTDFYAKEIVLSKIGNDVIISSGFWGSGKLAISESKFHVIADPVSIREKSAPTVSQDKVEFIYIRK